MFVNDMIIDTMRLVGRSDAAEQMASTPDEEVSRMQYTLLFCYNAVIDELARGYFPLRAEEELESENGEYALSSFSKTPVKIIRVLKDKKPIDWRILPGYLGCDAKKITVEYEYVPEKSLFSDDFAYPGYSVGFALVEYGMAAEYLLICGDIEGATLWESKYRTEIDRLLSVQTVKGRIPPRRWL